MESCDVEGCEVQAERISRLSPEGFLVGTGNKAYSFREAYKRFHYCEIHHEKLMKSIWTRVSDEGGKSDDHVAPTAI